MSSGEKPIQGTTKVERALRFFYPEQKKFPDKKEKNFDAEGLFWDSGSLYLLTKHRSDMSTTLYAIPIQESAKPLPAQKLGVFDVGGDPDNFGGRVTGADLSADGQYLAVLTYHAIFIFERPAQGMNFLANLKVESRSIKISATRWKVSPGMATPFSSTTRTLRCFGLRSRSSPRW